MSSDDIIVARKAMREAMMDYAATDSVRSLSAFLQGVRNVGDALGYKHGYGKMVEYSPEDGFKVHARIVDDEYNALPDLTATLPTTEKHARGVALRGLADKVSMLPTHEEYKRGVWRQKLADLVREGEILSISMEFIEMLKATAAKLSTNIITMQKPTPEGFFAPATEDVDDG